MEKVQLILQLLHPYMFIPTSMVIREMRVSMELNHLAAILHVYAERLYTFNHTFREKSSKRANSTNHPAWPLLCRIKPSINPKWFNFSDTNSRSKLSKLIPVGSFKFGKEITVSSRVPTRDSWIKEFIKLWISPAFFLHPTLLLEPPLVLETYDYVLCTH